MKTQEFYGRRIGNCRGFRDLGLGLCFIRLFFVFMVP